MPDDEIESGWEGESRCVVSTVLLALGCLGREAEDGADWWRESCASVPTRGSGGGSGKSRVLFPCDCRASEQRNEAGKPRGSHEHILDTLTSTLSLSPCDTSSFSPSCPRYQYKSLRYRDLIPRSMATDTRFRLPALDGFPLSVHRFDPAPPSSSAPSSSSSSSSSILSSSKPQAICIIINATGVAAQFYRSFAKHLSTKGVAVCTFDYRYSGQSFPPKRLEKLQRVTPGTEEFDNVFHEALLECKADWGLMSHWCRQDLAAVVGFARETWPGLPLTLLGNSLGAHLSTLLEEHTVFPSSDTAAAPVPPVRILNVCGGNAYWENNNSPEEAKFVFDQVIKAPLETDGVFRSSSLGLGYDLPYGAGVDWLKWFYHPLFSLQGAEDELIARALGEKLDKYLYVGFEDDATINQLMQTNHLSLFSHKRRNFHSLWIDPPKCSPPWPAMGHVTSFIPTRKVREAAQATHTEVDAETEVGAEERPGGPATEAYEPVETDITAASSSSLPVSPSSSSPLTREETIFPLYLEYILHGTVPEAAPGREHRVWKVEDERDRGELRRQWEQASKLEREREKEREEQEQKHEQEQKQKQKQARGKDKARL